MTEENFNRTASDVCGKDWLGDWLADDLTAHTDLALVTLVGSTLDYNINKTRAFVVALLEDVNDHIAAIKVNDVLMASE